MNAAIDDYLDYIRKHRSLRTYRTYRPTLNILFRNSYTKTYVDEVTREDNFVNHEQLVALGVEAQISVIARFGGRAAARIRAALLQAVLEVGACGPVHMQVELRSWQREDAMPTS